jgi:hypothetical protein
MTFFLVLFILGLAIAGITRWGVDSRDTRFTLWPPNGRTPDNANVGNPTPRRGDLISLPHPRQAERSETQRVSGSSSGHAA